MIRCQILINEVSVTDRLRMIRILAYENFRGSMDVFDDGDGG